MKTYNPISKAIDFNFKVILAICFLLHSVSNLKAQAPNITNFTMNKVNLQPYEKLEISLNLNRLVAYYKFGCQYDNTAIDPAKYNMPHDTNEVYLTAKIISPIGKIYNVQGFYFQNFYEREGSCDKRIKLRSFEKTVSDTCYTSLYEEQFWPYWDPVNDCWKIRFTPDTIQGNWNVQVLITDKFSVVGGIRQFTIRDTNFSVSGPPKNDGFLRIKEGRHRYIYREKTGNMEYMVPSPEPVRSLKNEYTCSYQKAVEEIAEHNINMVRIWIDGNIGFQWYTPIKLIGLDPNTKAIYSRIFNQMNCARLDTLFDLFESHGINVQLCLFVPPLGGSLNNQIPNNTYPMYNYCWAYIQGQNVYNDRNYSQPNIGEMKSPYDFFRKVNNMQRNMVRYAIARWGYSTNLLSWEVGNELTLHNDTIRIPEYNIMKTYVNKNTKYYDDTIPAWYEKIKQLIHWYDPHKHIITASLQRIERNLSLYTRDKQNTPIIAGAINDESEISGWDAKVRDKFDITVPHRYTACPICPDSIFANSLIKRNTAPDRLEEMLWNRIAMTFINNNDNYSKLYKKPLLLQEFGFDGGCDQEKPILRDSGLTLWDPYGFMHHNTNWLFLFSHCAGLPYSFNGPGAGEKYYLWKGPGSYWKGIKDIPDNSIPKLLYSGRYRMGKITFPDYSFIGGWLQDTAFTLMALHKYNRNYLRQLDPNLKPIIDNQLRWLHLDTILNNAIYELKLISPEHDGKVVYKDTIICDSMNGKFEIKFLFPKFLEMERYGDFAFKLTKSCTPRYYFGINNVWAGENKNLEIEPSDSLIITFASCGYAAKDSIVFVETDSVGNLVHNHRYTIIKPHKAWDTLRYTLYGNNLPLWCYNTSQYSNLPRYFSATLFTVDCQNNSQNISIKYKILNSNTQVKLIIHPILGNTSTTPLELYYAE